MFSSAKQQKLFAGFCTEDHDVDVPVMDQVNNLLGDLLEREDVSLEVEMQETTQQLRAAKLEAVHIEKVLKTRKETNHNLLLRKVAAVDQRLEQRKRMIDSQYQSGSCQETTRTSIFDKNSNYVEGESELMDSFSKLGDLQNQQKTLEDWYGSMSEQLQQEQLRLSLKFNEMKMKLLEQKKVYLQASQDCIDSLSLGSSTQIPASTKIKSPPSRIPQRISSSKTQRRHSTAKPVQTTVRRRTDREILQERYGLSLHGSESEVESGSASMAESDNTDGSSAQDCIVERTRGISPVRPKVYIEKQRKIHRSMEHIDHKSSRRRSTKTDLKQRDAKGCDAEVTANISSSTPVRQELNVIYLKDKQTSARSLLVDMENAVRDPAKEKIDALLQGYFTRKLMQTDRVQELITTIKDTKLVLNDLKQEKSSKRQQTKADMLLEPTLEQELKNAKSRLCEIFTTLTTEQKIKMITQTRLAAQERDDRLFFKEKFALSDTSPHKLLSTVTQNTLKRKKEGASPNSKTDSANRPYSAPPVKGSPGKKKGKGYDIRSNAEDDRIIRPHYSPPPVRSNTDGKQRRSFDIRSMKSIPSDCSISFNQTTRPMMRSPPGERSTPFTQTARSSMRSTPSDRSIPFNQTARPSVRSTPSDRSISFNQMASPSMRSPPGERSIPFNQTARPSMRSTPSDRSIPFNQTARTSMKSTSSDRSLPFSQRAMSMSPSDRSLSFKTSGRSLKSILSDRSLPFGQRASQDRTARVQIHETVHENTLQRSPSNPPSLVQRMAANLNRNTGAPNG